MHPRLTPERLSPEQLVERIAERDPEAMADLYRRYSEALLTLARRLLGRPEDAEEVLQETFLAVWRRARDYDRAKASVSTWLMVICRSRAVDRLRTAHAARQALAALAREPSPPVPAPDRADRLLHDQRRRRLRRTLTELPPEQYQALALAFDHGLTHRQISERLGLPLGTVKTRTYLGIAKLRRALGPRGRDLL